MRRMRLTLIATVCAQALLMPALEAQNDPSKLELVQAGKLDEARADWWGFDASDATACLQAAIDSGVKRLIVPNMGKPWIVNPIKLASNQEIILEPGTIIEAIRGGFKGKNDCLFSAFGKTNITVQGRDATLRMRKKDYQDATQYVPAEWRMGVGLYSCENVKLIGLTIQSSGGDGVYIGERRTPTNYCKDIVIKDCVIDDNHRQGISVISVVNLLIENCVIKNTAGTAPEAGIDFEPNAAQERLFNIVVRDCVFENNRSAGVIICSSPRKDTEPISMLFENCRAVNNGMGGFTGGFGARPPLAKIDARMTNCVDVRNGKTTVYNDFWRDWQNMQTLTPQEEAVVARVSRVSLDGLALSPADPAAYGAVNKKTPRPVLRGKAHCITWVDKPETEVSFATTLQRDYGKGLTVKITGPSGELAPIVAVNGKPISILEPDGVTEKPVFTNTLHARSTIAFKAAKAGTYTVELDPGAGWFDVEPIQGNMAILASDRPVGFFAKPGTFYFYVPAGVTDFYVEAAGSGGEKVKASLFNAANELVQSQDPVSMAYRFIVSRKDASQAEIWTLRIEKSPDFYMEDYSLDLYGVPPILATDKNALLKPSPARDAVTP